MQKVGLKELEELQDVHIDGELSYKSLVDHGLITEEHKGLFLVIQNHNLCKEGGKYCFGRNQDEAMRTAIENGFKGVLYGKQL